jgi:hypothetical protein
MITRMLLASVLAIGASSFAGCGDTDCPASFSPGSSCTAEGLSCTTPGGSSCQCLSGGWACFEGDMPIVIRDMAHDLATHDLANPSD